MFALTLLQHLPELTAVDDTSRWQERCLQNALVATPLESTAALDILRDLLSRDAAVGVLTAKQVNEVARSLVDAMHATPAQPS